MARVTTISINAKSRDLNFVSAKDAEGNVLAEGDGYVPDFMPGTHCGDYIDLEIDVETGVIKNWRTPSQRAIFADIRGM